MGFKKKRCFLSFQKGGKPLFIQMIHPRQGGVTSDLSQDGLGLDIYLFFLMTPDAL